MARSDGSKSACTVVSYDPAQKAYKVNIDGSTTNKMVSESQLYARPAAAAPSTPQTPQTPPPKQRPMGKALRRAPLPPPTKSGIAPSTTGGGGGDGSSSDDSDDDAFKEEEDLDAPPAAKQPSFGKKPIIDGPAFAGAGDGPGVLIWRVESMCPVPVDKSTYGKFHTGDAYIVLKTVTTKSGGFEYDLFFWLGEKCSVDEQGAAAILSRDLDDKLGGAPVQHRVVMGHEPPEFVAAMGGAISYLDGGVESGMRTVEAEAIPTRLLHVKGLKQCRVSQVQLSAKSLNAGDVFVLDTGNILYQWNGSESSVKERQKGVEVCIGLKDERVHQVELLGEVTHVQLDQGQPSEDEYGGFWNELKGDKSMVQPAVEDSKDDDKKAAKETMLYRLKETVDESTGKRKLTTEKLKGIYRSHLDPDDTFILVCAAEIYAWIGAKASDAERKNAMIKAQGFIPQMNKPNWTPVTRVIDGAEPQLFKSKFSDWAASDSSGRPSLEMFSLKKGISSGRNVAKNIREDAPEDIARKVMIADPKVLKKRQAADDEKKKKALIPAEKGKSLEIWRVNNFKKVPVEKELRSLLRGRLLHRPASNTSTSTRRRSLFIIGMAGCAQRTRRALPRCLCGRWTMMSMAVMRAGTRRAEQRAGGFPCLIWREACRA